MYNNISGWEYKLGIIYFLILLLFYINYQNFSNTSIEGFGPGDIARMTGQVGDIARKASSIPGQITGIGNQITGAVTGIASKVQVVEEKIAGIPKMIIGKIERFGNNLIGLISDSIVSPFMTLFRAMGNLFEQIGGIASKVIDKIKSLPNCSALYMYQSIFGIFNAIYKKYLPNFLKNIISTIYAYTLKIPLDWISIQIGLTLWWDKCFNFNVDQQVNSIRAGFNKVGPEFTSKFGHMNLKDLIKGL